MPTIEEMEKAAIELRKSSTTPGCVDWEVYVALTAFPKLLKVAKAAKALHFDLGDPKTNPEVAAHKFMSEWSKRERLLREALRELEDL